MARVPVANPFRQSGSRSASTTASSAKAAKKSAAKPTADKWTEDDQAAAHAQGWELAEIVDERTLRVFYEIQLYGVLFDHDGFARAFVSTQKTPLATKALAIVFKTKAGDVGRKKK